MLIENVLMAEKLGRDIDTLTAALKDKIANITPLGKEIEAGREQAVTWFLRGQIKGLEQFKKMLLGTDTNKDE